MNKLSIAAAVLIAAGLMSSCKKSDDNSDTGIVGSWELASEHYSYSVNSVPPVSSTTDTTYTHGKSTIITLGSDNSYKSVDYTGSTPVTNDSGTYQVMNSKFITKSAGSSTGDTVNYSISGTVMTLSQTTTQAAGPYTATTEISIKLNKQ